jgi:hypothetical protein
MIITGALSFFPCGVWFLTSTSVAISQVAETSGWKDL